MFWLCNVWGPSVNWVLCSLWLLNYSEVPFCPPKPNYGLMVACPELPYSSHRPLCLGLASQAGVAPMFWFGLGWVAHALRYMYDVSSHVCCTHLQVFVSPGDKVAKGDTLITLEGMKVEVSRDSSFFTAHSGLCTPSMRIKLHRVTH